MWPSPATAWLARPFSGDKRSDVFDPIEILNPRLMGVDFDSKRRLQERDEI
jgi:hypothetical protein